MITQTAVKWREIKGYEGKYEVAENGEVRVVKSGKILKPMNHRKGYLYVGLFKNGKNKGHKVHRLVAIAFIPNPENKPQVNHIWPDKKYNHVTNLEWTTASENVKHAFANGLKEKQINNIIKRNIEGGRVIIDFNTGIYYESVPEAARLTGINASTLRNWLYGRNPNPTALKFA